MNILTNGDWSKLTIFLATSEQDIIVLSDDKIAEITGSIDERQDERRYFPLSDNARYSIEKRALDAGFSVEYDPHDIRRKIFRRNRSAGTRL